MVAAAQGQILPTADGDAEPPLFLLRPQPRARLQSRLGTQKPFWDFLLWQIRLRTAWVMAQVSVCNPPLLTRRGRGPVTGDLV